MEKLDRNFYEILKITREADGEAIKKAYKKAALEHHPDKGGTDEMFQFVREAYDTLSDPIKKRNYDRDLKKYGLKDGLKKKGTTINEPKGKPPMKKGHSTTEFEETKFGSKAAGKESTKKAPFAEIPSNLKGLSVKELKQLLTDLGLKHDDCFEKQDMIQRVEDFKKNRKGGATSFNQSEYTRMNTEDPKPEPRPSSGMKKPSTNSASSTAFAGSMSPDEQISFKILSIGNQEVGKSCLIKRYCEGRFVKRYISTIGIDYGVKKLDSSQLKGGSSADPATISINFFDLSGNYEYKLIRDEFYADSEGVLMVYDVDNRDSYVNLVHWEAEMRQNGVDPNEVAVVV